MIRVKTAFMIFGLLIGLLACSQTLSVTIETPTHVVSSTPIAGGTEPTLPSPTPWVGGTQTALAVSAAETQSQNILPTFAASTPAQPVMEKPTGFSPVLYGGKVYDQTFFLLLGGVTSETWLAPDRSVARFSGEVTYSLHSLTQEAKYFLWGKSPKFSPICQTYYIGTDVTLDESGFVGVVDGWQITKRPVIEVSGEGEFYGQVVLDWLRAEGLSAPEVGSIYAYRVDIEADGVDEVFISAAHLDEFQHTTKAGDYSIILMRQVVGNDAVTKFVAGDIYRSQEPERSHPRIYSLTNFIDLNQDGRLEVVVETRKVETRQVQGYGAQVFQIDGEDVIQALGAEC